MKIRKQIIVAILGIKGKYGRWLEVVLTKLGFAVIGSDVMDSPQATVAVNRAVVKQADVVIIAVPIRSVVSVIRSILPFVKPHALLMDITSVKGPAVRAMLESNEGVEVVGLHPMCAPPPSYIWRGQTVVVCEARLRRWRPWVKKFLRATEARVKISVPAVHDKYAAVVQGLVHALALVMATVIRTTGVDVGESLAYTSPLYRVLFYLMGRILSQDGNLYGDIQMFNPHILRVLRAFEKAFRRFRMMVERKSLEQFLTEFAANRAHYGKENLKAASDSFASVISFIADLLHENVVVVRAAKGNRPGALYKILAPFKRAGIDLVLLHSRKVGVEGFDFYMGMDQSRSSRLVVHAIKEVNAIPGVEVLK